MKYIDTNVFIYAIEQHPEYGVSCAKILRSVQNKTLTASCSVLVLVEVISVLKKINGVLRQRKQQLLDIRANIDAILALPIRWLDMNVHIICRASEYTYTTSGVDYLHIATMEVHNINEIISADKDFDTVEIIKRINPLKVF